MGEYDYVPGINSPYDAGVNLHTKAILDTGANSTHVNNRRLLTSSTVQWFPSQFNWNFFANHGNHSIR